MLSIKTVKINSKKVTELKKKQIFMYSLLSYQPIIEFKAALVLFGFLFRKEMIARQGRW